MDAFFIKRGIDIKRYIYPIGILLSQSCFAMQVDIERVESELLQLIPKHKHISYTGVKLPQDLTTRLSNCDFSSVEININKSRPSLGTAEFACSKHASIRTTFELDGKAKALVAKNILKRKTKLNSSNSVFKWIGLTDIRSSYIHQKLEENVYELKRTLKPNQIIEYKHLDIAPVIIRGQKIKAVTVISNIRVEIEAVALEDGILGQVIELSNSHSKQKFFGKVHNTATVIIE